MKTSEASNLDYSLQNNNKKLSEFVHQYFLPGTLEGKYLKKLGFESISNQQCQFVILRRSSDFLSKETNSCERERERERESNL